MYAMTHEEVNRLIYLVNIPMRKWTREKVDEMKVLHEKLKEEGKSTIGFSISVYGLDRLINFWEECRNDRVNRDNRVNAERGF